MSAPSDSIERKIKKDLSAEREVVSRGAEAAPTKWNQDRPQRSHHNRPQVRPSESPMAAQSARQHRPPRVSASLRAPAPASACSSACADPEPRSAPQAPGPQLQNPAGGEHPR